MNRIRILLYIFLVTCGEILASTPLDSAYQAYQDGNYAESAALYEKISQSEGRSAALLANMGNAYAKSGNFGKAMLCYERSLRLDPSNKTSRININYVRTKVDDNNKADVKGKKISTDPDAKSFFTNIKEYVVYRHTSNMWAGWSAALFILTCGCVAIYIFSGNVSLRKIGFFGSIISIILSVIFLIMSITAAHYYESKESGILTGYKVTLLSEPLSNSKTTGNPLNAGTRLDILDTEEDSKGMTEWYKVRLNSDYIGWVRASEFEPI